MTETFLFSEQTIMPILLLVLLGFFLRRWKLLTPELISGCNRLIFRALLPLLLFYNIYQIETLGNISLQMLLFCCICILGLFFLGWLCSLTVQDVRQKGVIQQCVFRSNYALIGIPIAQSMGNAASVADASIMTGISIPMFNILAVIALSMYFPNQRGRNRILPFLSSMMRNPVVLGCGAGLLVLGLRELIPVDQTGELVFSLQRSLPSLYKAMVNLSRVASPLALVMLGGQFNIRATADNWGMIIAASMLRIVVAPALCIGAAMLCMKHGWFGIQLSNFPGFIALFATPAAVSSAIMAGEMNGDDVLASQLVVWTSIGSVFTMFGVIFVLRSFQIL